MNSKKCGGKIVMNLVNSPAETLKQTISHGVHKVHRTMPEKMILGFIGGAMISLGYLAYIRVIASVAHEMGSLASLIGASVFPIGLIVILCAGGELITGNMMAVAAAFFAKKVKFSELVMNWVVITIMNIIGALFVAYFFGHLVGLTSSGVYLAEANTVAQAKLAADPIQMIVSGIGCNWFVGLALWLCYSARDLSGKILGTWFPVMTFVAIGFQHSVANVFVLGAGIFAGTVTVSQFAWNFLWVYIGNIIGGAIFVSGFYYLSYKREAEALEEK
jgi:formate/nitrite transporter